MKIIDKIKSLYWKFLGWYISLGFDYVFTLFLVIMFICLLMVAV
jgi:hypothetical protein